MPFDPQDESLTGGPLIELERQDPNTGERFFRINGNLDVRGTVLEDGAPVSPVIENPLVYKGATDCSANPNYPAADAGDLYIVSVAGKIGGASGVVVEAGDMYVCKTDGTLAGTQAQRGTSWNVAQSNLLGPIPVKATGAEVDTGTDDAKFVTAKAIEDSNLARTADIPAAGPTVLRAYKTTNESLEDPSDVLHDDADLFVTLEAGHKYHFRLKVEVQGSDDEIKLTLGGTATFTNLRAHILVMFAAVDLTDVEYLKSGTITAKNQVPFTFAGGSAFATIEGTAEVNAGGTFRLRWAQGVAGPNLPTVWRGSSMIVTDLE